MLLSLVCPCPYSSKGMEGLQGQLGLGMNLRGRGDAPAATAAAALVVGLAVKACYGTSALP